MRISDWSSDVCSSDLIAPDERTRLVQSDGEGQAGLDRRVIRGKLVTPGPEAFFDAKGLEGVIAGIAQAEIAACRDDRLVGRCGEQIGRASWRGRGCQSG